MEDSLLHTDSGDTALNPLKKVALIHACETVIINHYYDDEMKTPMHMWQGLSKLLKTKVSFSVIIEATHYTWP